MILGRPIVLVFFVAFALTHSAAAADPLPGTKPIEWEEADLSARLLDGAHAFVDRKIPEAPDLRFQFWNRKPAGDYAASVEENRLRFRKMIGVVDERVAPRMEFLTAAPVDGAGNPPSTIIADSPQFTVHQIRWNVLEGLFAEGLYVNPKPAAEGEPIPNPPALILIPDADETPEDMLGIGGKLLPEKQMALRFAAAGFRLIIPTTINRQTDPKLGETHRGQIFQKANLKGRHVIAYEVQSVLAAADWLRENRLGETINVAGYGEGGLIAFYAAAADPQIDNALVSGYFGPRQHLASEPDYRNVFGLLREFGDAEIATLIWPRTLVIENSVMPEIEERTGKITQPTQDELEAEIARIGPLLGKAKTPPQILLAEANGKARGDFPASAVFAQEIGFQTEIARIPPMTFLFDMRPDFDPAKRHQRIFKSMQNHLKTLDAIADRPDRRKFRTEVIGQFDEIRLPQDPRSRLISKDEKSTAWEIILSVFPEFFTTGILTVPNDLKPGDKRPVAVVRGNPDLAKKLAAHGYITFSTAALDDGSESSIKLNRKANTIGSSLLSLEIAAHEQVISWLKTQPNVDPKRIAFVGDSGLTIPAVIEDYAAAVGSGNEATTALVAPRPLLIDASNDAAKIDFLNQQFKRPRPKP